MTHASVFSGIGGPEVAAAMLGWKNLFHCEINPFGRTVLEYWFPESESYEDIIKTDFRKWRGQVDVLTGGFPCQPFSYAGKRGGREDERYLWPQMRRVIDEVRPTWVVAENVAGITTMVEGGVLVDLGEEASLFDEGDGVRRYEYKQSFTIERICSDLEHIGYSVQPVLIPAAAVGAPHRRDRVFICAHVENTLSDGCGIGKHAEQRNKRDERYAGARDSERVCCEERIDSSNANGNCRWCSPNKRRKEHVSCKKERRSVFSKSFRYGGGRYVTSATMSLIPEERWKEFPTVSPVHARNDGLPVPMDRASIPFNKWRTESLKAYGNAIVPQVMYEIFRAIESVS